MLASYYDLHVVTINIYIHEEMSQSIYPSLEQYILRIHLLFPSEPATSGGPVPSLLHPEALTHPKHETWPSPLVPSLVQL